MYVASLAIIGERRRPDECGAAPRGFRWMTGRPWHPEFVIHRLAIFLDNDFWRGGNCEQMAPKISFEVVKQRQRIVYELHRDRVRGPPFYRRARRAVCGALVLIALTIAKLVA